MQQLDTKEEGNLSADSVSLQYPVLPVSNVFTSWISQAEPEGMASNPDEHIFDDTSSSLGDSAYEFIDDSSIVTSDSEDHEINLRLESPSDEPGYEQARIKSQVVADSSDSDQGRTESMHTDPASSQNDNQLWHDNERVRSSRDDGSYEDDQDLHPSIRFREDEVPGSSSLQEVEVSQPIKTFTVNHEKALYVNNNKIVSSQAVATVRQTMTKDSLCLDEPYKVLYIGDMSAKEAIISKIAATLAIPSENSCRNADLSCSPRFNIVPISSFGGGPSPEVELIDSLGLEMIVDECTAAFARPVRQTASAREPISLVLNDRQAVTSTWNGSIFRLSQNWKLPNIAVFYMSEHEDTISKQTRGYVQSLLHRHNVPSLYISQKPWWSEPHEAVTLNRKSLHICLESIQSERRGALLLGRLPVDLNRFLRIDPAQLSRNLACVAAPDHLPRAENAQRSLSLTQKKNTTDDLEKSPMNSFSLQGGFNLIRTYMPPEIRSILVLGSVLVLAIIYTVTTLGLQKELGSSPIATNNSAVSNPVQLTSFKSVRSLIAPTAHSDFPSSNSISRVQNTISKSVSTLSPHSDLTSVLFAPHASAPNRSDQFKVHVIRDRHIILRSPHWLNLLKRNPKLLFLVKRGEQVLQYDVSIVFDGVYALEISREQAHGILSVTVWTKTKPKINETFQVDFGSPWLKVAGLKKAAQTFAEGMENSLNIVKACLKTGVMNPGNDLRRNLREITRDATLVAQNLQKGATNIGGASINQIAGSAESTKKMLHLCSSLPKHLRVQGLGVTSKFYRGIVWEARRASTALFQQAHVLSRATMSVDIRSLAHDFNESRMKYLRQTQKSALRLWWRIKGEAPSKVPIGKARHKLRGKDAHSGKWSSR